MGGHRADGRTAPAELEVETGRKAGGLPAQHAHTCTHICVHTRGAHTHLHAHTRGTHARTHGGGASRRAPTRRPGLPQHGEAGSRGAPRNMLPPAPRPSPTSEPRLPVLAVRSLARLSPAKARRWRDCGPSRWLGGDSGPVLSQRPGAPACTGPGPAPSAEPHGGLGAHGLSCLPATRLPLLVVTPVHPLTQGLRPKSGPADEQLRLHLQP